MSISNIYLPVLFLAHGTGTVRTHLQATGISWFSASRSCHETGIAVTFGSSLQLNGLTQGWHNTAEN